MADEPISEVVHYSVAETLKAVYIKYYRTSFDSCVTYSRHEYLVGIKEEEGIK